jgi:hypothetical protein
MLPNQLSAPGERAARERVETLFARIDEIGVLPLIDMIIPAADPDHRDELLIEVDRVAARHGRTALLDEALDTTRNAMLRAVANRWVAGTYVAQPQGSARVEDRVALQRAIEDAVAVAVIEDVLDRDVAEALADPGRTILGLAPLGEPIPGAIPGATPAIDWAPTVSEWAAAAGGVTAIRPGDRMPIPGGRAVRLVVIGTGVAVGLLTSAGWILTQPTPLIGLVAAAIVLLMGWTLALPPARD